MSNNPFTNKCEIIIVDDGSSDDSTKIVENYECAKLIKHARNQGYGQAIVTGMQNSTRDNVVWMDADGQHQVSDVVKLCKILSAPEIDFVIGEKRSRFTHQVKSRLLGKFVLRMVVKLCGVSTITDFNSGLRGSKLTLSKISPSSERWVWCIYNNNPINGNAQLSWDNMPN